jgi:Tfp pilus assembly protein PilO
MNIELSEIQFDQIIDKLPELETKAKIGFFVGIFVLIIGLCALILWWGKVEQAQYTENEVQEKLQTLETQASVIKERMELERELIELRKRIPELIEGFPAEDEVAQLLDSVYRQLGSNGMYLSEFKPQPKEPQRELSKLPFKVKVEGRPIQVAGIPNLLASLSRKVNLADFKIYRNEESSLWVFEGQIDAYAQLLVNEEENAPGSSPDGVDVTQISTEVLQ